MTDIPVLKTQRLDLRAPEAADYPDFKATFTSYRARFMGGPLNAYEAWMLYAAEIGHWEIRGFGMWMVHLRDTGETVGMAGGWCPADWPEREIAWIIWPEKAGQGFALEATSRVRRHFYEDQGWDDGGQLHRPQEPRFDPPGRTARRKEGRETRHRRRHDAVYRHPSPPRCSNSQIAHGIEHGDPELHRSALQTERMGP